MYNKLVITHADSVQQKLIQQHAFAQIEEAGKLIRSGDIITHTGNDFTSEMLRRLNQHDKTYSHCGIASIEHDSIFIYHALGGDFNPNQKIRRDPLTSFCDPFANRGFGIFRFKIADSITQNVVAAAKNLYHAGVVFDMDFNLASNDSMYCTEYVYKSLLTGSNNRLHFNISHLQNFAFIGVDDLFKNPACVEIKRFVYK